MKVNFNEQGQFFITAGREFVPPVHGYSAVAISLDGDYEAQLEGNVIMATSDCLRFEKKKEKANGFEVEYSVPNKNSFLKVNCETFEGIEAMKQTSTYTNLGKEDRILTQISSAQVNGICYDESGIKDRLSDGSIEIHYCIMRWQGEGQWRNTTPEYAGLTACADHIWSKEVFRIDSLSTWSTSSFYPLVFIVDKKKNECFYFEKQGGESWFIEIFVSTGDRAKFLSVKAGTDEKLGLHAVIKNGETFTTTPCVYGVVKGGIEEAVRELTKFKRKDSFNNGGPIVAFNDFMNCNWALPTDKKLIPLIDKASEIGTDIFCIDDGWSTHGDWVEKDSLFGNYGFKGIIDYIKKKGMKAGVWTEIEFAGKFGESDCDKEYVLTRYGKYLASNRKKVNLNCPKARAYLIKRIGELYDMGVRYIKNDHNNNEGIGFDGYDCFANSVSAQAKGYTTLIEEIRAKYPDLILENCSAGGMRMDSGTLRHFAIQSISDQEDYRLNPAILGGVLACVLPEKASCWCYPCPKLFHNALKDDIPEEEVVSVSSERQTAFNVINSMLCSMCVSGKIDQLEGRSSELLKKGIKVYKRNMGFIKNAYPIFPKGFIRISDKTDYALGLISERGDKILLAVWNLSDKGRKVTVDIEKYKLFNCSVLYYGDNKTFSVESGKLVCDFSFGEDSVLLQLTK